MGDPIRVLLVDDEPRNLDALEAVLEGQGYDLLRAGDADRTLKLLLEHGDIAVIVMDIRMPEMNGIELAQVIKGSKRFGRVPILFLSAHLVDDAEVLTGYGAGAVDYLTKPFNPQIMRHKVAVFADLFRKTRDLAALNDKLEERVKERTLELEKSEAALRASARQKDEFLAVLAHELRNPLAPLRTGLDLLGRDPPSESPAVTRTLAAMNRQMAHIVRLIDDLLDVSRINTGTLQLKKQRVDITAIVNETVETFRAMFDDKEIAVAVDAPGPIHVVVDPTRLSQILGNVLHNASKYTPPQGHVRVTVGLERGQASIQIADSGVGVPPQQLARVFDMFTKIERPRTASDPGAGIGLALSKRLAEMHGGRLRAVSPGEGKGTTFTLTLPAASAIEPTFDSPAVRPSGAEPRNDGLDVLVIEDNEDSADLLVMWLERRGHRVRLARTGPSGLDLLLASPPDVVLCDLGLPGMDGVEVCRRARQALTGRRPVMVALTGWGKEEDRERTKAAGFDQHLVKPVPLETLAGLLATVSPTTPLVAAPAGE